MRPRNRIDRARWALALRVLGLRRFCPPYRIGERNVRLRLVAWAAYQIVP